MNSQPITEVQGTTTPVGESEPRGSSRRGIPWSLDGTTALRAIAFWALAMLMGGLIRSWILPPDGFAGIWLAVEGLVYLGVTLLVAGIESVRQTFAGIGWLRLAILLVLGMVVMVVQMTKTNHSFFPFVCWTMYSDVDPEAEVVLIEYIGVTADGTEFAIWPGEFIPALGRYRLQFMLRQMLGDIFRAEGERRRELAALYRVTLQRLMGLWNRYHPDRKIVALRVRAGQFSIDNYPGDDRVPRRELYNVR